MSVRHQGKRKAKLIGDRETALKVARVIRERIADGELHLGASGDGTLETYATAWLKGLMGNLKPSTIAFYSENLRRYVLPALGHRPVGAIVRADCRELVAGLRGKGLKLNIVRGIARTLSALLSQAVEDEKLPANPALRMGKYLRRGDDPNNRSRHSPPRRSRTWSPSPNGICALLSVAPMRAPNRLAAG